MSTTSFPDFFRLCIPTAIALLVSTQVVTLVNEFQTSTINPAIGLIPGLDDSLENVKYTTRSGVIFAYGSLISTFISFMITIYIAYIIVVVSMRFLKIDALRKL